jgi:FAD/FMN-containing dehydrogenase
MHTKESFSAFRAELEDALGRKWVKPISGTLYDGDYAASPLTHDAKALFDRGDLIGSLIVSPGDVPDVQAILRLANKHGVPLWVISIGRNLGYGGASPRVRGSVVVHLGERMNKVEEVNEELAYCRVQPGVSYADLYEHLHKVSFCYRILFAFVLRLWYR